MSNPKKLSAFSKGLGISGLGTTLVLSLSIHSAFAAPLPGGTLDPTTIPKFVEPLTIPPAMPLKGVKKVMVKRPGKKPKKMKVDYYEVEAVQLQQQVLPSNFPKSTVWGYGAVGKPETRSWPGYTFETRSNKPVQVKWFNNLVDDKGDYLQHLFKIDQTLHWANPPQDCIAGPARTDCRGSSDQPYTGPVPVVNHLHGAHVGGESDGYPEAWMLPNANDIPAGYATTGSLFTQYDLSNTDPGTAVYLYPNDQRAATLWYHDHSLGMTRLNVQAGLAGFWMIRDKQEKKLKLPEPYPTRKDAKRKKQRNYHEIPLLIQDRSFNDDGSLFFPESRAFFDQFNGPYIPTAGSDVSPIWNPEFFGNTITVNGKTWPYMDVEPRKYRLRLLNGSNARFFVFKFNQPNVPFTVIGSDGGLLGGQPVVRDQILLAPAERLDVIVDFSGIPEGTQLIMQNIGPDSPFGGFPIAPADLADATTTGQIMAFNVGPRGKKDKSRTPKKLKPIQALGAPDAIRDLTLNEEVSSLADIPIAALLGTAEEGALTWSAPITENPAVDAIETWRIANLTEDGHPIHLHLIQFQVLSRTPFDAVAYGAAQQAYLDGGSVGVAPKAVDFINGPAAAPDATEAGWKDTVIAYPGEITQIKAKFDREGLYVWHCHILDHEDNEMMRPFWVGDPGNSPVPVSPLAQQSPPAKP